MKHFFVGSLAMALAAATLALGSPAVAKESMKPGHEKAHRAAATTMRASDLHDAMRVLWEEHIVYTRNFIISSLGGLEDAGPIAERLLRNQDDIGNAIKPIYGDDAGTKLAGLLRAHILIAADIVTAAKNGDNAGVGKGQERWKKNADDIATFLAGANPNWPLPTLKELLYKHLDYTTAEVVSRLKKDWAADIQAYDKGHAHMLMFADALTDGIVKQFPKKFHK
jgi:hypothetical protein